MPNVFLHGQFGFDVFNKSGELKYSKKNIDNFITSQGMEYPYSFFFADCFRYISFGFGNAQNSISNQDGHTVTTGLAENSPYTYIGGMTNGTSNYLSNGCGYTELNSGVKLSRAWRIPSSDESFFDNNYSFREVMVSPGRPFVEISHLPDPPEKLCSSSNYSLDGSIAGLEESTLANYYGSADDYNTDKMSLCEADKAFARIVIDKIDVDTNDYLVASYDLYLYYNTGLKDFRVKNNTVPTTFEISGKGNLVHPGVALIYDGNVNPYKSRASVEYGESFYTLVGCPLEPSMKTNAEYKNFEVVVSDNNTQFSIDRINGGSGNTPADFGCINWQKDIFSRIENQSEPVNNIINARTIDTLGNLPNSDNYTENDEGQQKASINSTIDFSVDRNKPQSYDPNGRSRTSLYSFENTISSAAFEHPIRAITLCFRHKDTDVLYPFFDAVLYPKDSNQYLTFNNYNISVPTSDKYYSIEAGYLFSMHFGMTWTTYCPQNVIGCS